MPNAKSKKTNTQSATSFLSDITPYKLKKGEKYMSDPQREHFKSALLKRRKELMEEVDNTIDEMQVTDVSADPNDRATIEEMFSRRLKDRDRDRRLIKKIENALQQLEDNEYGYCESCGEEIGIRRLEARLVANLCIECKTLAEIREKRTVL